MRWQGDKPAIIALYVDDLVILTHPDLLADTKKVLAERFPVKDLEEPASILGIEVIRDRQRGRLELRQSGHIASILAEAGMVDCKPITTPMEAGLHLEKIASTPNECANQPYRRIVGMLLYVACATRWDIGYNVAYLCRFVNAHNETHWKAVKHLLRYLQGTRHQTIVYQRSAESKDNSLVPVGYSDADWASDRDDRKSISAYLFTLAGGPIAWASKKQKSIATSSCEAELYALSLAAIQALYIRRFFEPLRIPTRLPVVIHCDSQSALAVAEREERQSFHARFKHLSIRRLHIADNTSRGLIRPLYCPTTEMLADPLTKALPATKLDKIKSLLGIHVGASIVDRKGVE